MDNTTFRIPGVQVATTKLAATLAHRQIKVTRRIDPLFRTDQILFSMPVGRHVQRWLFRVDSAGQSIVCSGGVTKTLFGHNVWVFSNEATQLRTITDIVSRRLISLDGLKIPSPLSPTIERAELTRHHRAPSGISKEDALRRLDMLVMTLKPTRYSNEGRNHDNPGTTRVGKTKSSRAYRSYDPAQKFAHRPAHIPERAWTDLCESCASDMRLEFMFNKRELKTAGLDTIAGWDNEAAVLNLLGTRYRRFGLSVAFRTDQVGFSPKTVRAEHPSFVEPARHFFSNGEKGSPLPPRNGGLARFKRYMLDHGYCVDVPFERHVHLAHGLHEVLQPQHTVMLPDSLRRDPHLFAKWWKEVN